MQRAAAGQAAAGGGSDLEDSWADQAAHLPAVLALLALAEQAALAGSNAASGPSRPKRPRWHKGDDGDEGDAHLDHRDGPSGEPESDAMMEDFPESVAELHRNVDSTMQARLRNAYAMGHSVT